jgi:hypothetical protein
VAEKRRATSAAYDRSLEAIASHAKTATEVVLSRSQQLEEATRRIDVGFVAVMLLLLKTFIPFLDCHFGCPGHCGRT